MENKKIPSCVSELVATDPSYGEIRYVCEWQGFSVYDPIRIDEGFYGCEYFILEKNGEARWTEPKVEYRQVFNYIWAQFN